VEQLSATIRYGDVKNENNNEICEWFLALPLQIIPVVRGSKKSHYNSWRRIN
jgi:hypothetical protein